MQNPFSTTFSRAPEQTYITTDEPGEIIDNFSYEVPTEAVYKITGVRGSGKTVTLAKVEEEYESEYNRQKGWLVYRISPARDLIHQLAAMMYKESFVPKIEQSKGLAANVSILGTGGGFSVSRAERDDLFDVGAEIDEMMSLAAQHGKKIMIGIDEVSRTKDMIAFASEFGKWLRAGYPVYLVCTGLYENIKELSNVKNLTFFRRATTIRTNPLSKIRMTDMYRTKLDVPLSEAKRMAELTKGYAYAFQELGILYFRKNKEETLDDIIGSFKAELFAYSYEKIWEELSDEDRRLVGLLTDEREYSREELLEQLGKKAKGYSVYRDRLLKKGIINARKGYISLALPFFGDYMREYCMYEPEE